jgi:hypothetical protein
MKLGRMPSASVAPRKTTKSQLDVCGAPARTNFLMPGGSPSIVHPAAR